MLGIFDRSFLFETGNGLVAANGATVEVRHSDSGSLATLYSNIDGTIGKTNPFAATAQGRATFYCEGSSQGYRVDVTYLASTETLHNVPIGSVQYLDEADVAPPDMSALGQTLIAASTEAEMQQILEVEPGVDVQEHHANLDTLAGASAPSAAGLALLAAANAAAQRILLAIAGKNEIPIAASALAPRATNGCAPLAVTTGSSDQPDVAYLAFDGASTEYATFGPFRMPKSWDEGTIAGKFNWRRASGTGAANVRWGMRAVAVSDNETPAVNFGTGAIVLDAASTTTANFCLTGETAACTVGGTPSEGDLFFIEIYREAAHADDTLNSVDAWLSGFTLVINCNETKDD